MVESTRKSSGAWLYWGLLVLIVAGGACLRFAYVHGGYDHPDEPIPLRVVDYMETAGTLDTNWANAELPALFKYDQYNFSSYILTLRALSLFSRYDSLYGYRLFSVFCGTLVIILLAFLPLPSHRRETIIYAATLTAVAPILVQDSHYARPEAFTTALILGATALCWPREKLRMWRVCVGAFLVGFLVACKVSMLFYAWLPPFPIAYGLWQRDEPKPRRAAGLAALAAGGMVLGFLAGVPAIVVHLDVYIAGVQHLLTQYSGWHAGASMADGGMVHGRLVGYVLATLGWPAAALFFVALFWALRERQWPYIALVFVPFVFFAVYFATKTVFFERNISHVVPFYLVGAGYGLARLRDWTAARFGGAKTWTVAGAVAVLTLAATPPAYCSYKLVFRAFSGDWGQEGYEHQQRLATVYPLEFYSPDLFVTPDAVDDVIRNASLARQPFILVVLDLGDELTATNLQKLDANLNMRSVGVYETLFPDVPPCTLHTYASITIRYYLVEGTHVSPV